MDVYGKQFKIGIFLALSILGIGIIVSFIDIEHNQQIAFNDATIDFSNNQVDVNKYINGKYSNSDTDTFYTYKINELLEAEQLQNPNATLQDHICHSPK